MDVSSPCISIGGAAPALGSSGVMPTAGVIPPSSVDDEDGPEPPYIGVGCRWDEMYNQTTSCEDHCPVREVINFRMCLDGSVCLEYLACISNVIRIVPQRLHHDMTPQQVIYYVNLTQFKNLPPDYQSIHLTKGYFFPTWFEDSTLMLALTVISIAILWIVYKCCKDRMQIQVLKYKSGILVPRTLTTDTLSCNCQQNQTAPQHRTLHALTADPTASYLSDCTIESDDESCTLLKTTLASNDNRSDVSSSISCPSLKSCMPPADINCPAIINSPSQNNDNDDIVDQKDDDDDHHDDADDDDESLINLLDSPDDTCDSSVCLHDDSDGKSCALINQKKKRKSDNCDGAKANVDNGDADDADAAEDIVDAGPASRVVMVTSSNEHYSSDCSLLDEHAFIYSDTTSSSDTSTDISVTSIDWMKHHQRYRPAIMRVPEVEAVEVLPAAVPRPLPLITMRCNSVTHARQAINRHTGLKDRDYLVRVTSA